MGCEDAVLPELLLWNGTISCLTFEENTRQPFNGNLCLFRALARHLHGNERLEEKTSKLFNLFINKMDGLCRNQFQGVHMNNISTVEELLTLNILLYDKNILGGNIVGEFARRIVQKYDIIKRLLRYNNHKCYLNNFNAVFQSFRCPNSDIFFFFQQSIQFGATFNHMQWTSGKCLSAERISNPRNSLWQAGLFR